MISKIAWSPKTTLGVKQILSTVKLDLITVKSASAVLFKASVEPETILLVNLPTLSVPNVTNNNALSPTVKSLFKVQVCLLLIYE